MHNEPCLGLDVQRGQVRRVMLNGKPVEARVDKQVSPGVYQVTTTDVHNIQGVPHNVFHAEVLPILTVTLVPYQG